MTTKSKINIKKAFVSAAAIVLAGLSVYTIRTDLNVYVTHYSMMSDKVTDHMRIVQISDFHNDHLLGSKMLEKVRSESPDIIVITGDFIDKIRTDIPYALDTAESLAEMVTKTSPFIEAIPSKSSVKVDGMGSSSSIGLFWQAHTLTRSVAHIMIFFIVFIFNYKM